MAKKINNFEVDLIIPTEIQFGTNEIIIIDPESEYKDFCKKKLMQVELKSHNCNEDELLDVLSLFENAVEMAFEQVSMNYNDITILK